TANPGPPDTAVSRCDAAERWVRLRLPLPFPDKHSTHHVSFSPDGRHVATCSQGMDVVVWDAATGKEVRRLLSYQTVMKTALSPDGRTLAAAHNGGTVLLWDLESGRLSPASADPIVGVGDFAFRDHGRRLVGPSGR